MPKKRRIAKTHSKSFTLPLVILGVVTLAVVVWYSLPRPTPPGIHYVGEASGTASLTLSPSAVTSEPNVETTLTLSIDGGAGHVTGAQISLAYDASKIGTPVVTLGSFLPNVLSSVKTENNTITFTLGAPPDSGGLTGSGNVATIKIKPTVEGTSSLAFGDSNAVTTIESQTNMLKSANNVTVTVAAAQASTAASAQASAIASAIASSQASASPSTAASATPQTPSKPTGLRSNCYNNGTRVTLRWDAVSGVSSYKLRLDQKDGSNDKSIDGITKTEYDLGILAGQKYSWWVHASKDGVDSEAATTDELICAKTATSTSTPTPTPKATVKPTVKPSTKPTSSPTSSIKPVSSGTPSTFTIASPLAAGSLNDIFGGNTPAPSASPAGGSPNFFQKVALGWQAIFAQLAKVFIK